MKKTYINPDIAVIKIATQQMLAQSVVMGEGNEDPANAGGRYGDLDDDF